MWTMVWIRNQTKLTLALDFMSLPCQHVEKGLKVENKIISFNLFLFSRFSVSGAFMLKACVY